MFSACGSSATDGRSADGIFSDPVDAPTLRQALITGSTAADTAQYWLCSIGSDGMLVEYRLFADNSGTEIDQANPTVSSDFTWETLSSSSMITTVAASGMIVEFTDIQFSGRNVMNLAAAAGEITVSCTRQGEAEAPSTPAPQPAANSLTYGGATFPLTHGFLEPYRYPTGPDDTHATFEVRIADAPYQSFTVSGPLTGTYTVWAPFGASVRLEVALFSPVGHDYGSGEFTYVPDEETENTDIADGGFYFARGSLGVDTNGDGEIEDDDNEYTSITGGSITVEQLAGDETVAGEDLAVSFSFTLADGVQVVGSFTGDFPVFAN